MPLHPTVSPLSALLLQAAGFLKLFASIKWRDPVGKFLPYWLEVFAWIKKTTGMVRSPCSVWMCFKVLTVFWTKARENFQFERNAVRRCLLVVSLCVRSELGLTEAPWQKKSSENGLKFRLLLYLYIFYFNLLCSPWEEEWWFSLVFPWETFWTPWAGHGVDLCLLALFSLDRGYRWLKWH